jgi:hypothetical protein
MAASRPWSPILISRSRAGARPTTGPSSSASRRDRQPGTPPMTTPQDKVTFDFTVMVPDGITVMANGVLASQTSTGGKTTFVWRESSPNGALSGDRDTIGSLLIRAVGTGRAAVQPRPTQALAVIAGAAGSSTTHASSAAATPTGPASCAPDAAPAATTPPLGARSGSRRCRAPPSRSQQATVRYRNQWSTR